MDVEAHIAQLEQALAEAKPMPLSASVLVSRREFEEMLTSLRNSLPEELRQARWVIRERDDVVENAKRDAERILEDARKEAARIVSETEIVHAAHRRAEEVYHEARDQARVMRLEAEDYIDAKLANFEVVLQKTLAAVERGRDQLRGRLDQEPDPADAASLPQEDLDAGTQFYDHERLGPT